MSTAAWEAALTRMEDELDQYEEAVRTGHVQPVAQWAPPENIGPLPAELAERVTHLTKRIGLLTTFVEFQLASTENDLRHLASHGPQKGSANRTMALFLDASV